MTGKAQAHFGFARKQCLWFNKAVKVQSCVWKGKYEVCWQNSKDKQCKADAFATIGKLMQGWHHLLGTLLQPLLAIARELWH